MMTSLLYNEQAGHDSQVETYIVDPVAKTVTVSFLSYPTWQSPDRIPIKILFSKVTSVSAIMDFEELETNRSAGNVTQWHIAKAGTSFIQLTGGCLAITSREAPTLIDESES